MPVAVVRGLGIADPAPRLRPAAQIAAEAHSSDGAVEDPYSAGKRHSLLWVLGRSDVCPGTGWAWVGGPPDAEQVAAEHHILTGRVYRPEEPRRAVYSGADEGLSWALGRC